MTSCMAEAEQLSIYTDMTEKNKHQHKYFPIINMCLFMFTGENSEMIFAN